MTEIENATKKGYIIEHHTKVETKATATNYGHVLSLPDLTVANDKDE